MKALIGRSDPNNFIHEVISLTSLGSVGQQLQQAGVKVYSLGLPSPTAALRELGGIRHTLASAGVIHTWMYHANLIGGLLAPRGRPLLWSVHATELDRRHTKATTRLMVLAGRWLSQAMPEKVAYCSLSSRAYHAGIGYDMSRALVINNGIDTARFRRSVADRQSVRSAYGLDGRYIVGNVARWHPQKDHATLLRAFAAARQKNDVLHLVLVGDGLTSENADLAALLRGLNIEANVSLLGPTRDIPAVLSALDIFAMSSAFGEALPLALCEAMACELPAIVADVGDCADVVADCGWIVPPADVGGLSAALTSAATTDEPVLAAIGRRARVRICEQFNIEASAHSYQELYQLLYNPAARNAPRQNHT